MPRAAALTLAFAWLFLATADARVFLRWGATSDINRTLRAVGGHIAYEADITINGGKGRLSVASFDEDMPSAARRLGRAFGRPLSVGGGGLTIHTIERPDAVLRLVLFDLPTDGRTIAIAIHQTPGEAAASAAPPDRHLLAEVPAYSQSTPRFFCRDEEFGMAVAVSDTPDHPETVRAVYAASLQAAGWRPAAPADPKGEGAFGVYTRGRALCVALVSERNDAGGGAMIAVLHKPQGVE